MEPDDFRRLAKKLGVPPDVIEKDYVLTWLIAAIYNNESKLAKYFVFKGGTALRKVYFPEWRLSEDLDFTLLRRPPPREIRKDLEDVLRWLEEQSGIRSKIKEFNPTANAIHASVQFDGKLGKNQIRFDISLVERMAEEPAVVKHTREYDEPEFEALVYSLDELLAEKIRSLVQRTKVRDYYDVWRLLKKHGFDARTVKNLVKRKCEIVGIEFDPAPIFDLGRLAEAEKYWEIELSRLTTHLPNFQTVIAELRDLLRPFIS